MKVQDFFLVLVLGCSISSKLLLTSIMSMILAPRDQSTLNNRIVMAKNQMQYMQSTKTRECQQSTKNGRQQWNLRKTEASPEC
jgi:hypothetical protein